MKEETKLVAREANAKTLRDDFAIAALPQSMMIMYDFAKAKGVIVEYKDVAETAYLYADAMLKARK